MTIEQTIRGMIKFIKKYYGESLIFIILLLIFIAIEIICKGKTHEVIETLIAYCGFVAIIVTIIIQCKHNREQLQSTENQNREQLFEAEIQNLLNLAHQKKQAISIYRGPGNNNWERTLITGNAAFIEIINNFIYSDENKEKYKDIKSCEELFPEMDLLIEARKDARKYEEVEKCVKYDIGEIKSWITVYMYTLIRIEEYGDKTGREVEKYIELLKSNLNRNERLFLSFSKGSDEYKSDPIINRGLEIAVKYGIIKNLTT